MAESDAFWRLDDATEMDSQDSFYEHLKRSDHLKFTIFTPDMLTRSDPNFPQKIEGKTFEKVSFSKTKVIGLIFTNCVFRECQFIGATLEGCEFHRCQFVKTNTYKISIVATYLDPLSFSSCLHWRKHQNIGVHLYQALMNNSRDEEQIEFERDAQFLFFRWKRYQDGYTFRKSWSAATKRHDYIHAAKSGSKVLRRLGWEKLFGCGIRISYFLRTLIVTLVLATIYNYTYRIELGLKSGENIISTWSEALYFTTVSLTTLGYGDITPTTAFGQISASCQRIVGFALFALVASMLLRRVTP